MPFDNPIVGGTALVRAAINSPNYVAGSSGWAIKRDGSAEFNSGTFRGPVLIGSPPAAGAASLGLTGTAIPAVLRGFSVDYTWAVADIYWINGVEFFFDALVNNSAFVVEERITGIYTVAGGVQLQTFIPANAPNSVEHGSGIYDTHRLQDLWRASDINLDQTSTLTLQDGATNPGVVSEVQNISRVGIATLTTTSAVPAQMNAAFSVTIVKRHTATSLYVVGSVGTYITGAVGAVLLAVRATGLLGGTASANFAGKTYNVLAVHQDSPGSVKFGAGLAPDTYTITIMWSRSGGTGTVTSDAGDWISLSAQEVH